MPEDSETFQATLARMDERVAAIAQRMGKLESAVYGAAGLIVVAVIVALIALVVKSPPTT